MNEPDSNINALELSPQFWWRAFDRAITFTDGYAKSLVPDFDYKKWLTEGIIEHDSTTLHLEECHGYYINAEYEEAITNNYFYRVGIVNQYGNKVTGKSIEELQRRHVIKDTDKVFYTFRMADLNHLISLYFQHWILFNTHYYWARWQLYYDFVNSKVDKTISGLFQNMWHIILVEMDHYSHVFKDVKQYKQFRDKLDQIEDTSNFVRDEYIRLRDAIEKK